MAQLGLVGSLHPLAKAILASGSILEITGVEEFKILKDFECRTRAFLQPGIWHFESTMDLDSFDEEYPYHDAVLREACNNGDIIQLLSFVF